MNTAFVIRKNYQQLLVVVFIFLFMIAGSLISTGIIMRRQLIASANEFIHTADANLKTTLREPESTLISSAFNIQDMIMDKNHSQEDILRYLITLTDWLTANEDRLSGFNGMYGFIREEFLDGTRWEPPEDYVPQERPWYIDAKESPGQIIMTSPYVDAQTNSIVVSFAQELFDDSGRSLGVLAMDVQLTRLESYVRSLKLSEEGYGILLNENLEIMVHPDGAYINKPLGDLFSDTGNPNIKRNQTNKKTSVLTETLAKKKEINALQIWDKNSSRVIVFFRQAYNGWYLGLVVPEANFYHDIYRISFAIFLVGTVLMFILCYMLIRLSAAKLRSDEENKSKSSFLARMSHEIRTPMNAVIGMSELALRAETLPRMNEYVTGIKQAGLNLLSLINDILDLSKIEAGSLQINSAPYLLASLINDVLNVIRIRINEKPILFTANVDAKIPNNLVGDEARIRQILLNLLSNAAKYTRKGYIMLTIGMEKQAPLGDGEKQLILTIEIADSGIGIKKEDLSGLFGNFVRFDAEKNKNIEGTGLGLAITRNLCLAMGGDITAQSEYGKGSVFTARIPQGYTDDTKLAELENPEEKRILFYDDRAFYAESLFLTLENLGLTVTVTITADDFLEKLKTGEFPFAFVSESVVENARKVIQEGDLKTVLTLLANLGEISSFQDIPIIIMPAWSVPIANVLNGIKQSDYRENAEVRFIAPEARVLIVDDIETNLKVAEGLLALYQTGIHTCTGGEQAIALVKEHSYDIVFMDHMMPGMDGIEATEVIRALSSLRGDYFRKLPIIALTANAVAGMKEMFLSKGFTDYLAKPIEMSKLEEIMAKWIPREKKQLNEAAKTNAEITSLSADYSPLTAIGVDLTKGIAMTGGTETAYRKVLSTFRKDVLERLPLLEHVPNEQELSLFTTSVHALKSAAGTIGAAAVSKAAAELEAAGKAGDLFFITEQLPQFYRDLQNLVEQIGLALDTRATAEADSGETFTQYLPLLTELAEALKQENIGTIHRILAELEEKPFDTKTKETISSISNAVLMSDFEDAIKEIETLHR
ncbi:hybrid sensor histidine kinase/response regulator [Treponema primitia]|uniref:hybrid sensor histidine kinase/response regulator n=1 Tax=Treponema primitia TaxID=88058 RepID=UPI00025554EA|nr:ATP-binding protein [Treponema primitia]